MRRLVLTFLALLFVPATAFADVSLEPDPNRFGTVRPDGTRIKAGRWWDPFGPNVLKGDRPIFGNHHYLVLTGILDNATAQVSDVNAVNNNTVLLAAEFFRGQTVFKPKDWSLRVTGLVKTNAAGGGNVVNDFQLGETFFEVLVDDYGRAYYDSTSARAGIQGVKLDVQGLILNDAIPGVRTFSSFRANRHQLDFVYGRPLEKGVLFNAFPADIVATTWTVQDFLWPGFDFTTVVALDYDRRIASQHQTVGYVALATSGHVGRWVHGSAVYLASGTVGNVEKNILASMFVFDFARPSNYWTPRLTWAIAPGDSDPNDTLAGSFDAIADKVAFAGADGTGIIAGGGLVVGGNTIYRKGSVIPSLRGANDRPNFEHGGGQVLDLGVDVAISPRFTLSADWVAFTWFETAAVSQLTGIAVDSTNVGSEAILKLAVRPFLNENALVIVSGAALSPGGALDDLGVDSQTKVTGRLLLVF